MIMFFGFYFFKVQSTRLINTVLSVGRLDTRKGQMAMAWFDLRLNDYQLNIKLLERNVLFNDALVIWRQTYGKEPLR